MNKSEEYKKNSRDLIESLLLHSILDTPKELIFFALDLNYCYTAFTTFHKTIMKNIWGVEIEIGTNMLELISSPEDRQKAKNNFDRTLKGEHLVLEEDYGDENLLRTFYQNHYNPIKTEEGKVIGLSVLVVDQTKNKLAQEILRKSEENLSVTLQSIGDAVISTDVDGRIMRMNPVAEKLCGYSFAEAQGKSLDEIFKIINSDTRETVDNPLAIVLKTGNIVGLANHTILLSKDGREYQIADSAAPIKNDNGKILGIIIVFSDVTEKYTAQKFLEESEEKYRTLAETAEDIIITYTPKGEITYLNEAALELTNLTRENYLGTSLMNFVPKQYHNKLAQNLRERNDGYLEKRLFEMELLDKDGREFPVEVASSPLVSGGKIIGFLSKARNITERKAAEDKLKANEKKYRLLIENAIDMVFTINSEGFLTYISPSSRQFGGYDEIEELGKHFSIYLADRNQLEKFSQTFQEIIKDKKSQVLELYYLPKDRKPFWAEVSAKPIVVDNVVVEVHCVLRNIEERKQAEEKIRAQLNELKKWQATTIGREERIIEMKREVNELLEQLGLPKKYNVV